MLELMTDVSLGQGCAERRTAMAACLPMTALGWAQLPSHEQNHQVAFLPPWSTMGKLHPVHRNLWMCLLTPEKTETG